MAARMEVNYATGAWGLGRLCQAPILIHPLRDRPPPPQAPGPRHVVTMAHTYCTFAPGHPFHGPYHDREYGFPRRKDAELFERLILEVNQAGLSWLTILQKREGFRQA